MRSAGSIWLGSLLACLMACQPCQDNSDAAREEIRSADVALDLAAAEKDLDRFTEMIHEDAVFYGSREIHEGRAAVVQNWAQLFEPDGSTTLRWQPIDVTVARSGDLGYTRGQYQLTTAGEDGSATRASGSYVTIWRKSTEDARWRAVLDIGTPPQPAQMPAAE
jgi:ketosteroid isomerase-like protein